MWHIGSGPPGQIGNTVLAGHSSGASKIFRDLDEVKVGEDIFIKTNRGWHHYHVGQRLILREQRESVEVRASNARWILPIEDERPTIVTCWPYPLSTHRLLVIAYPVSATPISNLKIEPPKTSDDQPIVVHSDQLLSNLTPVIQATRQYVSNLTEVYWSKKNGTKTLVAR